jgi:hypothetical protein
MAKYTNPFYIGFQDDNKRMFEQLHASAFQGCQEKYATSRKFVCAWIISNLSWQ